MWVPRVPSMATIKDNAQFAKGCMLNCNSPDLLKATIVTAVCVVVAMVLLALLSMWAVSGKSTQEKREEAVGAVTSGQTAGPMLREAVALHDSCLRERDPESRRIKAQRALELVHAAERLADPETLRRTVGCDTTRLSAALIEM